MATHAPSYPRIVHTRRLFSQTRVLGVAAAALAALALAAAAGQVGMGSSAVPAVADPCSSPAAIVTFTAWPPRLTRDDPDEVLGERRPDSLAVTPEFRAFQECRNRQG